MIAKTFVQNNATVYITSRREDACRVCAGQCLLVTETECIPFVGGLTLETYAESGR